MMRIGSWQAPVNLVAIEMKDFDLILGQEFLRQATTVVAPHLSCIMVLDPMKPCMIPTVRCNDSDRVLSSLSLKRAGKKGNNELFLAALLGGWDEGESFRILNTSTVCKVLEEFANVMPDKLLVTLPPRRHVDHRIEPEAGARPTA